MMQSGGAEAFLHGLSGVLSLPGLSFNEDSVCCLLVPGGLEVQIEWVPAEHLLLLLSPIGELGDDPEGSRARELLAANFLFAGTRGETLSLEGETGRIFLCARIESAQVSIEHALDLFTRFIDTAERWRAHLEAGPASARPMPAGGGFLKG